MKKVLVLGAGASHAYGYPLGWELRQEILAMSDMKKPYVSAELSNFQQAFGESMLYSVDAFLARRTEFADIGKRCIAHVLLSRESREHLFSETEKKDHWYQYLINRLTRADWEDLDFYDISFISFNYDRSLEHFLLGALLAIYGRSQHEIVEKLRTLEIIHVYGTLGSIYPDNTDRYRNYDKEIIDPWWIQVATESINVIPEGREKNAEELKRARALLEQADGICFLGFGFDELNVERLAEDNACGSWKLRPNGHTQRTIIGTRLGMTDREADVAWNKLTSTVNTVRVNNQFKTMNCTQLLRETLFLG